MSIYKHVVGDDFQYLHPMLQKRYQIPFEARGIMGHIQGGPKWLFPLFWLGIKYKLLFPERGENIPFSIKNTRLKGPHGEEQIHWERIFHFGSKKRFFNATMSLDEERMIIKDYLGEPSLFYSDLAFTVSKDGSLQIKSQNQKLILGKFEIPLPKMFQALAIVKESYLEDQEIFHISVTVTNTLIGTVFAYEGDFNTHEDTPIYPYS
ncbi:DUF4166 domain-containing protein [Lederbergia galactosidilytica]|uniref:DUF4166 domain-containing protein n=1 Tax=Lederbergia galactosidilytica TaxID=217031 RepID=A0A0Q9XSU5_9BACI|nr:DUF4166 domain-containing protein [Lederbergia galactosidilytica]KRG11595.1 hypothetical protein ACA29_16605 [Lederbergia galactosidilytica]OAK67878.1 hypothetical protein ABB05_17705 [Lederbergia galactosidilytica]